MNAYLQRQGGDSSSAQLDKFGKNRFFVHKNSQTLQHPAVIRHLAILQH
ncbi:MAG: hypothetical protein KDJ67_13970 [Nitratireductor sp.]|nr:hypothetical protein [Nitratireductor sp.]